MKYTKIPANTFEQVQLNAGLLLTKFEPSTAKVDEGSILGATSGGINFTATPTYKDYGEDIDNCPKNTKELKKLDTYEATMSGSFVALNPTLAKSLIGAADVLSEKITPRADLADTDFSDIWWVGDYSDKNGEANGGFIAIHLINALSTGGFQMQSTDKDKGKFNFTYMAHYSLKNPNTVPFEVYVKAGSPEV